MPKSKLEKLVSETLRMGLNSVTILENTRPDWLVSSQGERLELESVRKDKTMIHPLPCPFCGNEDLDIQTNIDGGGITKRASATYIFCNKCAVSLGPFASKEEAIAEWNKRYQSDFLSLRRAIFQSFISKGSPLKEEDLSLDELCELIREVGRDYATRRTNGGCAHCWAKCASVYRIGHKAGFAASEFKDFEFINDGCRKKVKVELIHFIADYIRCHEDKLKCTTYWLCTRRSVQSSSVEVAKQRYEKWKSQELKAKSGREDVRSKGPYSKV